MRAALEECYGNPSSTHWAGQSAKELVEASRAQVAALLGCAADEIVFTSGGSEANNLALKGMFFARRSRRSHHHERHRASFDSRALPLSGATGRPHHSLPVDGTGRIDPDDLRRAITPDTILISLMHANNEVGTIRAHRGMRPHRTGT